MGTVVKPKELPWCALADPGGGGARHAPPPGSKFFHFHAVFGKKMQYNRTLQVGPPPQENPASATGVHKLSEENDMYRN